MGLGLVLVVSGLSGCDDDRFVVPEGRKIRPRVDEVSLRPKTKLVLPLDLPLWTSVGNVPIERIFQPEPVKIQGQQWVREGHCEIYEIYFQPKNVMAAREVGRLGDSIARFLRAWYGKPFRQRLALVLIPETDPTDHRMAKVAARLQAPETAEPRIVVYTGSDNHPYLSKYGVISEVMEGTIRWTLTGQALAQARDPWRSLILPAYFSLRATGAMVEKTYDQTARPKGRQILSNLGWPSRLELEALWQRLFEGSLEKVSRETAIRSALTVLAMIEDRFGAGALALLIRDLSASQTSDLWGSIQTILGYKKGEIWKAWEEWYVFDAWRRKLESPPSLLLDLADLPPPPYILAPPLGLSKPARPSSPPLSAFSRSPSLPIPPDRQPPLPASLPSSPSTRPLPR